MRLSTKEIVFLAGIYKERTQLSLFANINSPLDGTEEKSLAEKGVYKEGVLSKEAKEILDVLAKARRCSRVALKDNSCLLEKYTYSWKDKIILVENDNGDLLFSVPQGLSKTISEFSEFTGISRIKATNMELLLSSDEVMVLLALVDIYRKNALVSYMNKSEKINTPQLADIFKQLEEPMPNSLVNMLKKNYNYDIPEAETTKVLLEGLVEKNCIINEKGYELTDEYAIFANNFLIPEAVVMLESFNLNEKDEVISAVALCICAGIKDIVAFIFSKDEIELSSISSMQLLQMTENFLNCPEID